MSALLDVQQLHAGYGAARVLFGVDLRVEDGGVTALLGRNGMGKTTLIRSIVGQIKPTQGNVRFGGTAVTGHAPHAIARAGVGVVPEGRQVFPRLTVRENLRATARLGHWTETRTVEFLPRLAERMDHFGHQLSGGEQQMLAIGRALMTNPRLLVLDEATEGLAPLVRAEIWDRLSALKQAGLSILVVDKHLEALTTIADAFVVLDRGLVVHSGTGEQMRRDLAPIERHLHL